MFKKIIIGALVIWGLLVFYEKFMKPILEPYFKTHKSNVDLFGIADSTK